VAEFDDDDDKLLLLLEVEEEKGLRVDKVRDRTLSPL